MGRHAASYAIMLLAARHAPLAQLDRASGYEPEGREFESCRARHLFHSFHTTYAAAEIAVATRFVAHCSPTSGPFNEKPSPTRSAHSCRNGKSSRSCRAESSVTDFEAWPSRQPEEILRLPGLAQQRSAEPAEGVEADLLPVMKDAQHVALRHRFSTGRRKQIRTSWYVGDVLAQHRRQFFRNVDVADSGRCLRGLVLVLPDRVGDVNHPAVRGQVFRLQSQSFANANTGTRECSEQDSVAPLAASHDAGDLIAYDSRATLPVFLHDGSADELVVPKSWIQRLAFGIDRRGNDHFRRLHVVRDCFRGDVFPRRQLFYYISSTSLFSAELPTSEKAMSPSEASNRLFR